MTDIVSIGMDQAKFYVLDTGVTYPGTTNDWLPVYYKTLNFTSSDVQQEDTTSIDFAVTGELWQSHIKTALGGSFSIESIRRTDPVTHERDAAQARLETLDRSVGYASKGWFRLELLDENVRWDFKGIVKCTPFGGGLTDVQKFSADITIAGPPTIDDIP